jgi:hypothetical protein
MKRFFKFLSTFFNKHKSVNVGDVYVMFEDSIYIDSVIILITDVFEYYCSVEMISKNGETTYFDIVPLCNITDGRMKKKWSSK